MVLLNKIKQHNCLDLFIFNVKIYEPSHVLIDKIPLLDIGIGKGNISHDDKEDTNLSLPNVALKTTWILQGKPFCNVHIYLKDRKLCQYLFR